MLGLTQVARPQYGDILFWVQLCRDIVHWVGCGLQRIEMEFLIMGRILRGVHCHVSDGDLRWVGRGGMGEWNWQWSVKL